MVINIAATTSKNLKEKTLKRPNVNLELSFVGGMPVYLVGISRVGSNLQDVMNKAKNRGRGMNREMPGAW